LIALANGIAVLIALAEWPVNHEVFGALIAQQNRDSFARLQVAAWAGLAGYCPQSPSTRPTTIERLQACS
jgi:hypothetical protein